MQVKGVKTFGMTTHVMVGVLMIHVILLPILYLTIIDTYKNNAEEQFVGHVREVTGLLSDVISSSESMEDSNRPVLLMESALLGGEVLYIELVDQSDRRLTPAESMASITGSFIEDHDIGEHDDGIYYISVPLKFQLGAITYTRLRLGFDESVVVDRLALVKQRSVLILGSYFICIIILLGYLTKPCSQDYRINPQHSNVLNY